MAAGAEACAMVVSVLYDCTDRSTLISDPSRASVDWLEEHEYDSVSQIKGSMSMEHCPDPDAFERANYMKTLASFSSKSE